MKYLKLLVASALSFIIIGFPYQTFGMMEEQDNDIGFIRQTSTLTGPGVTIPLVARGHEEVYRRFLKGVLVYRPNEGREEGRIDLPIASLGNPLEDKFDLSRCGDTGKYLSISTGYRKRKTEENENKLEIWLTPRFLVEKEIKGDASYFQDIFPFEWPENAPVGIVWNLGSWVRMQGFDYLTRENFDKLGV